MSIEQQIEELWAELTVCIDAAERGQIEAELAAARDMQRKLERGASEHG
jgi:hypothetical protein